MKSWFELMEGYSLKRCGMLVFVGVWLGGVAGGLITLCRYGMAAGEPALTASSWPASVPFCRPVDRATLVMSVHPCCPCSRASMSELATLAANCPGDLSMYILFAEPRALVQGTRSSNLWHSASHIPGATLIEDRNGVLSKQFGAMTSGQVFLYDASGTLRFNGGITGSRGHAGNNAGRAAIEAIVRDHAAGTFQTPVFGCSIW